MKVNYNMTSYLHFQHIKQKKILVGEEWDQPLTQPRRRGTFSHIGVIHIFLKGH